MSCIGKSIIMDYFLEYLYHFKFPLTIYGFSSLFASSPVVGVIFHFNHSDRCDIILKCIFLMFNDVEHIFMCSFVICILLC